MGRNSTKSAITEEGRERLREKAKAQWAARSEGGGGLRAAVSSGGPPKDAVAIITKAAENGCNVAQIAKALGVGRTTFLAWREQYPELEAAYRTGMKIEHDMLVGKLHELAMGGNLTAIIFSLKAKFGYSDQGGMVVENKVSINFQIPASLSPHEYLKTVAARAELVPQETAKKFIEDKGVRKALTEDLRKEKHEHNAE